MNDTRRLSISGYCWEAEEHNAGNKIRCQEATCGFTYCCTIECGCVVSKVVPVFRTKLTFQDIRLNGHGRGKVALLQAPRTCGCVLGSAIYSFLSYRKLRTQQRLQILQAVQVSLL